jgi:Tol biopolymer transport system component
MTRQRPRLVVGAIIVLVASFATPLSFSAAGGPVPLLVFPSVRSAAQDGLRAGEFANLVTLGADGRGLRRLTVVRDAEDDPQWSPNGRQIAFSRGIATACNGGHCDVRQAAEIWVTDAGGGHARRVTREPISPESAFIDRSPTWSPDGKEIAFVHARTVEGSTKDGSDDGIYVIGVNGRGAHRVLKTHQGASADWSPDGKRLAIVHDEHVGLLDLQTSRITPIGNGHRAAWSPDGRSLAVVRDRGIYVLSARGGAERRVVRLTSRLRKDGDLYAGGGVSWSPDGRQLTFNAVEHGREDPIRSGNTDVFIVEADGSDLRRITANPYDDGSPDWRGQ